MDACVLVGFPIVDLLLRIAQRRLYGPCWTKRILKELERRLVGSLQINVTDARRRVRSMSMTFPEALIPVSPEMRFGLPYPDDDHVLAGAIVSGAQAIVTFNTRDVPLEICARHGVEVVHPDEFLSQLLDDHTPDIRNAFYSQVGALAAPPLEFGEVLKRLTPQAPKFVDRLVKIILQDVHDAS